MTYITFGISLFLHMLYSKVVFLLFHACLNNLLLSLSLSHSLASLFECCLWDMCFVTNFPTKNRVFYCSLIDHIIYIYISILNR